MPFREDGNLVMGPTTKGRWSYACCKAIDEFLALAYWQERKLPAIVVRLFNTVGPRQTGQYGMVIPTFVRQALAKTDHGVRRRHAVSAASPTSATSSGLVALMDDPSRRPGVQHRQRQGDLDPRARGASQGDDRQQSRSSVPYDQAYEAGFEDMPRRVPDISKIRALSATRRRSTSTRS